MGTLERLSEEIDAMLVTQHIGAFELPSIWLEWIESKDDFEKAAGITPITRSSEGLRYRHFVSHFFPPIGGEYYDTMVAYMKKL
jgi:hypothetical protein